MEKIMKKIIAAFLALITAVSLVSCGNIDENNDTDRSEASEEWTFNTEFGDVSLPDDVKNAFDKAMDGYDGTGYIPVAYLGTQTVSVEGEINTITAPQLTKEVGDLSGIRYLVFDLDKVRYVSSAGLRLFLNCQRIMESSNGDMLIKNCDELVEETFTSVGYHHIIKVMAKETI